MKDKITFIVKSFERKECVEELISSCRKFYPDVKIIVVDDSLIPIPFLFNDDNIEVYYIGYDRGLSYGRNYGILKSDTPYVLLLDDDFFFTKKTDISLFFETMEKYNADIVGGNCVDFGFKKRLYRGNYEIKSKELNLYISEERDEPFVCDFCLNFFLAKTDIIKSNLWDEEIKIHREHDDFFLRLKSKGIKVVQDDRVEIDHYPSTSVEYFKKRRRVDIYETIFNDKFNINKRSVHGRGYKLVNIPWSLFNMRALKYIKLRIFSSLSKL